MSLLLLFQNPGASAPAASPLYVAYTDPALGVSGESTTLNADPAELLFLRFGDNLFGIEIDAPSCPDLTGATAALGLDDFWTGIPVPGLAGLPVTILQAVSPAKLRFSWPSPWPGSPPAPLPVGRYRLYFSIALPGGRQCSTGEVLLAVVPA